MLTRLWEREFEFLQYKYVELAVEVGAPLIAHGIAAGAKIVSPRTFESEESEVVSSSSFARMDEFDSTLYFLDDSEIDYLQREIRNDFGSDLRSRVVASLLDTYEREPDPTVAKRSPDSRQFFLLLLSLGHFGPAAYIIREAKVTAGRAQNILDSQTAAVACARRRAQRQGGYRTAAGALETTRSNRHRTISTSC